MGVGSRLGSQARPGYGETGRDARPACGAYGADWIPAYAGMTVMEA